jgi:hypothetical protein
MCDAVADVPSMVAIGVRSSCAMSVSSRRRVASVCCSLAAMSLTAVVSVSSSRLCAAAAAG